MYLYGIEMLAVLNTITLILISLTHTGWCYPYFNVLDIPTNDEWVDSQQLDTNRVLFSKRGHPDVDVWQLCPQRMAQADCFYTYLRVYARLRKGARNVEPVNMRNIGKRDSQQHSLETTKDNILLNCPDYLEHIECFYKTLVYAKKMIRLYNQVDS